MVAIENCISCTALLLDLEMVSQQSRSAVICLPRCMPRKEVLFMKSERAEANGFRIAFLHP